MRYRPYTGQAEDSKLLDKTGVSSMMEICSAKTLVEELQFRDGDLEAGCANYMVSEHLLVDWPPLLAKLILDMPVLHFDGFESGGEVWSGKRSTVLSRTNHPGAGPRCFRTIQEAELAEA